MFALGVQKKGLVTDLAWSLLVKINDLQWGQVFLSVVSLP